MIPIAVMTVERGVNYLDQTLPAVLQDSPAQNVLLTVGRESDDHVARWRGRVAIETLRPELCRWADRTGFQPSRWFNLNYRRTIRRAGTDGIIVLEDDAMARPGWHSMLAEALAELRPIAGPRFCLAMWSEQEFAHHPELKLTPHVSRYPSFSGTVACYYSGCRLDEFAALLWREGIASPEFPGDWLAARWYGPDMYACTTSIFQHIGDVSSGCGGEGRRSPTFERPW